MQDITGNHPPLPRECEQVRFVVAGHRASYLSVYEHQCFRSRWASYGKAEVSAWCTLSDTPRDSPPPRATSDLRSWSERPMREGCLR